MNQRTEVSQIFNTFVNLLKELEPFVEVNDLKLSFDREGNAYLTGTHFQQQLHSNLTIWREVKEEMRQIIAKHCLRISPEMPAAFHDEG